MKKLNAKIRYLYAIFCKQFRILNPCFYQKREEIEKKLDQADEQERESHKKERSELFQKRKEKRVQLKCLEQKLQRVEVVCDFISKCFKFAQTIIIFFHSIKNGKSLNSLSVAILKLKPNQAYSICQ